MDTCNICGMGFKNTTSFIRHEADHRNGLLACSACCRAFTTKRALQEHFQRIHSGDKPSFGCSLCDKSYYTGSELRRHITTALTVERPFKCHLCDYSTNLNFSLKTHLKSHTRKHQEPTFTCTLCDKRFHAAVGLRNHAKVHSDDRSYNCTLCPKALKDDGCLKRHTKLCHESVKIQCVFCDATFHTEQSMTFHVLKHIRETPYSCGQRSRSFFTAAFLKGHVKRHHVTNKPLLYACKRCPTKLTQKRLVKSHMLNFHGLKQTPRRNTCLFCNKLMPSCPSALLQHMHVHTGETPYTCPHCSIDFADKGNLGTHIQWHTGDKPHKCPMNGCLHTFRQPCSLKNHLNQIHNSKSCNDQSHLTAMRAVMEKQDLNFDIKKQRSVFMSCVFCNKGFSSNYCLLPHLNSHTRERPHCCPLCSRGFADPGNINVHLRVHTGEKPHTCSWNGCTMTFRDGRGLNRHATVHSGLRPFGCEICKSRAFATRDILRAHQKRNHPKQ